MKNSTKYLNDIKLNLIKLIDEEKEILLSENSIYHRELSKINTNKEIEELRNITYGRAMRSKEFKQFKYKKGETCLLRDSKNERFIPVFIHTQRTSSIISRKKKADKIFQPMGTVADYVIIFKIEELNDYTEKIPQRVPGITQVGLGRKTRIKIIEVVRPI